MSMSELAYDAHTRPNQITVTPRSLSRIKHLAEIDAIFVDGRLTIANNSVSEIVIGDGFLDIKELVIDSACPVYIDLSLTLQQLDELDVVYISAEKGLSLCLPQTEMVAKRCLIKSGTNNVYLLENDSYVVRCITDQSGADVRLDKLHQLAQSTLRLQGHPVMS